VDPEDRADASPDATLWSLLRDRVRRDGARPVVTYLDLESGERMELSTVTLANIVAKTAGLLRDDLDVAPGTSIALHLPMHWQASVWFAACAATAAIACPAATVAEIGVAASGLMDAIDECGERVQVSLAPFGLPDGATMSPDVLEAAVAARVHPDEFTPWAPPSAATPLLTIADTVFSHADVLAAARDRVVRWRLAPGGRLLLTADENPAIGSDLDTWLALLAVPLVADAAVVIMRGGTPEAREAATVSEAITSRC
jgi:uncharacterized protein (TIGR03089 family)